MINLNDIFAEFMGYEYIPRDKSDVSYMNYGWWKKGTYQDNADPRDNGNFLGITAPNYYLSYDLAMKVWVKLRDETTVPYYMRGVFNNLIAQLAVRMAYGTLSEFVSEMSYTITWYNGVKNTEDI